MTKTRFFLTVSLLAVLLATACTPASTASPAPATDAPPVSLPTATLTAIPPTVQADATLVPTEAAALPVPTSRGPNLEATDPLTVKLDSGQLQLVEFFRFT